MKIYLAVSPFGPFPSDQPPNGNGWQNNGRLRREPGEIGKRVKKLPMPNY